MTVLEDMHETLVLYVKTYQRCTSLHCDKHTCRGMATFMNGIPDIFHDFCSIYGGKEGSIAGLYSLDETRCYYFYGFPVSKVCYSE